MGGGSVNQKFLIIACAAPLSIGLVSGQPARTTPASKPVSDVTRPAAPNADAQRALINQYCVGCHNVKANTANLQLDKLDLTHLADHGEIGEKVIRKLRA